MLLFKWNYPHKSCMQNDSRFCYWRSCLKTCMHLLKSNPEYTSVCVCSESNFVLFGSITNFDKEMKCKAVAINYDSQHPKQAKTCEQYNIGGKLSMQYRGGGDVGLCCLLTKPEV